MKTDAATFMAADATANLNQGIDFSDLIERVGALNRQLYYRDQTVQGLTWLVRQAESFGPTRIIEIGTLFGLSLRAWLAAAVKARVTAVDLSFKALAISREIYPLDMSRVDLIETDALKLDFANLWNMEDRVLLFIDAHDRPGVYIMDHCLRSARKYLPPGSLVMVDDLWFSPENLTGEKAKEFFQQRIINEIDPLQCFEGHYISYWQGGSFFGFREVIPLISWINENRIELFFDADGKSVGFYWPDFSKKRTIARFPVDSGSIFYNPVSELFPSRTEVPAEMHAAHGQTEKGIISYAHGNLQGAFDLFCAAARMSPLLKGTAYRIGVCLARAAQFNEAADFLERELQLPAPHERAEQLLKDIKAWSARQGR